jgi:hypothetical protein
MGGGGEEAGFAEALHLALIGKAMCTLTAKKGTCNVQVETQMFTFDSIPLEAFQRFI